jgi:thiol-disulfide isomerase/thioredoxin
MLERILFSIIVLLLFVVLVKVYGAFQQRQIRRRSKGRRLPIRLRFDKPTLLYFWTPECSQCKPQEQQIEKAVTNLRQSGKMLQVHKYNAHEEQTLANAMQVMTVPTTILLDSQGAITGWNAGLMRAQKIVDQYNKKATNSDPNII